MNKIKFGKVLFSMYLGFDCETTGLNELQNNLLSVCFVVFTDDFVIKDKLNMFIKHNTYTVDIKALEINKIDLVKHHSEAIDLCSAKTLLLQFLRKNLRRYRYIAVGHNVSFDIKFVKQLLSNEEFDDLISCNVIDTVTICQYLKLCRLLPKTQSLSLINLCKYFRIPIDETKSHDAEYDILQTIKLLECITIEQSSQKLN